MITTLKLLKKMLEKNTDSCELFLYQNDGMDFMLRLIVFFSHGKKKFVTKPGSVDGELTQIALSIIDRSFEILHVCYAQVPEAVEKKLLQPYRKRSTNLLETVLAEKHSRK